MRIRITSSYTIHNIYERLYNNNPLNLLETEYVKRLKKHFNVDIKEEEADSISNMLYSNDDTVSKMACEIILNYLYDQYFKEDNILSLKDKRYRLELRLYNKYLYFFITKK